MSRDGYWEPPRVGDEADTLVGSLERMRATFWFKCSELDRRGLGHRLGRSELTLGRLVKHLAFMEDLNFTRDLAGAVLPPPWSLVDPDVRSEWVFASADHDSPQQLYCLWQEAVARSNAAIKGFLQQHGPAGLYQVGTASLTARRLLVDMIEEYGRHTGHADLLREDLDGRTGEDPPGKAHPFTLRIWA